MSSRRYHPSSSSMNCRRQHGASQCSQSGNRATAVMSISPKNERLRSMLDARAAFREQVELFVRERYALDPTAATIAGIHDHDARLADLSEAGFAARDAFADSWLAVCASHDGQAWPARVRHALALARGPRGGERALRPPPRLRPPPAA